jgi:hypothetical protein
MKTRKTKQKKSLPLKKDDYKDITVDEFDNVMKKILSVPPPLKKKDKPENK